MSALTPEQKIKIAKASADFVTRCSRTDSTLTTFGTGLSTHYTALSRTNMTKDEINALRVGDHLHDDYGEFRIMAMAEGYVMMRRLGCTPFAAKLTDFMDRACFKGSGPLRVGPLNSQQDKD